jgi:ABC-type lipoprotein release transport system permease subunit
MYLLCGVLSVYVVPSFFVIFDSTPSMGWILYNIPANIKATYLFVLCLLFLLTSFLAGSPQSVYMSEIYPDIPGE